MSAWVQQRREALALLQLVKARDDSLDAHDEVPNGHDYNAVVDWALSARKVLIGECRTDDTELSN